MKTKAIVRQFATYSLSASLLLGTGLTGYAHHLGVPGEEEPVKKARVKTRITGSRNNNVVKIYPDIIRRDMHVVAKEGAETLVDFFVFDVQGSLVMQKKMKPKEHQLISGLKRGTYLYRVFQGDRETAFGEFEIR